MYFFKYYFVFFCYIFYPSASATDVDMDYFYGTSPLRSVTSCQNGNLKRICESMCQNHYGCIAGRCFCLNRTSEPESRKKHVYLPSNEVARMSLRDFRDLLQLVLNNPSSDGREEEKSLDNIRISPSSEEVEEETLEERPVLRHHIAHFCPNLGDARNCIRTCMKVGKPAFCGKDHVCYCGHRYSAHDKEIHVDPGDMYAQFRDLYTKYFGPNNGNDAGGPISVIG